MLNIKLDNKAEQVMLFLRSKHNDFNAKGYPIYLPDDDLDIEYAELKQICKYLESINFLKCEFTYGSKQFYVFITRKGISYLESLETEHPRTLKGKILKWFKNNALEIIAIIISIIALLKP